MRKLKLSGFSNIRTTDFYLSALFGAIIKLTEHATDQYARAHGHRKLAADLLAEANTLEADADRADRIAIKFGELLK